MSTATRQHLTVDRAQRATRRIGPDEMFFSTTDVHGVIRSGNAVFAGISGYSVDELVASPHNIIRHPEMPAGVFSLMWERLLSGRPMAGYVLNLAKDGSGYWVFATITPTRDGFLSVRISPSTPSFEKAVALYADVRPREIQARAEGLSAPAAARAGGGMILDTLARAGYNGFDDYMAEVLPAEVAARAPHAAARVAQLLARVSADGGTGPVRDVVVAAAKIDGALAGLVARLEAYQAVATRLLASAEDLTSAAGSAVAVVEAARQAAAAMPEPAFDPRGGSRASAAGVLRNVADAMAAPAEQVSDRLRALARAAHNASTAVAALRVDISLARLHTEMATLFAGDVLDGKPMSAGEDIPLLCDAIHKGLTMMGAGVAHANTQLSDAAEAAADLTGQFNEFRRLVGMWRILVVRHRAGDALGAAVEPIDAMLDASHARLEALGRLADDCREAIVPVGPHGYDATSLEHWQENMRVASSRMRAARLAAV